MHRLIALGRTMFALGMIGIATLGIIYKDFIVGRPPEWSNTFAGINPGLAYASSTILIICCWGIMSGRYALQSALLIAAMIFLFSTLRHLPVFTKDWVNTFKSMAILGGALIIAGTFSKEGKRKNNLIIVGTILLAAFFIASGYAHFKWPDLVAKLIPDYIPFRLFWAYFCGVCLFAGGLGILIPQTRKWAALLSGIMVLLWFFLLHIPRFLSDTENRSDRLGVCESFLVSGIFFVLAGLLSKR